LPGADFFPRWNTFGRRPGAAAPAELEAVDGRIEITVGTEVKRVDFLRATP